jgi:hypothetical protein
MLSRLTLSPATLPTGLLKGRSTVYVLENQDFGVCAAQKPPKPGFL